MKRLNQRIKEALGGGYIGEAAASRVESALPGISNHIGELLSSAVKEGDWQTFTMLANLARWIAPAGLARQLTPVLEKRPRGVNKEDLVEILGEIESVAAVPTVIHVFHEGLDNDGPGYWLCKKCIATLGTVRFAFGAEHDGGASVFLQQVATGEYPKQLKWEAAVELGIEDDLGFDEEEMTV